MMQPSTKILMTKTRKASTGGASSQWFIEGRVYDVAEKVLEALAGAYELVVAGPTENKDAAPPAPKKRGIWPRAKG